MRSKVYYTLMQKLRIRLFIAVGILAVLLPQVLFSEVTTTEDKQGSELFKMDTDNVPTYVKSDSLTVRSNDGVFEYIGNVELKHGDLTLTSQKLEGQYDDNNEIQVLTALQNVIIVKGENIRATSQKAVYEKKSETMTLTDNPELQEGNSVLSADAIKIFLDEDRSVAEGQVRVKLVEEESENKGKKKNANRKMGQ